MEKSLTEWLLFGGIVLVLMIVDIGMLHRKQREISVKESFLMCGMYMLIACLFGAWVWDSLGAQKGKEFFTGYVIELTLAMDNIFVISLILTYFAIPRQYQHRALFWGIMGAIILRGIMIGAGAAIVEEFHWVLYIFAVFLILTGIKMLVSVDDKPHDVEQNPLLKFMRAHFFITKELHGEKFFVRLPHPILEHKYATWMTPLFVAVMIIEIADLVFAVDSVPAIFAITTDPYIVYTSNIFAIMGLRALYFALDAVIHRFAYLKYALAVVLMFIGSKIFIADFILKDKFPISLSMGITFGLLGAGVLYSLYKTRTKVS